MAYMSQDRKAKIVAAMKPIMQKYNVKGTFKCDRHSITFRIKSGSVDFIGDMNPNRIDLLNPHKVDYEPLREKYNLDINPYWYQEHYTGTALAFLSEAVPAMKAADYYDRSDAMTDYFDTAYYYHINVGSWDKPYDLTK